MLFRRVAGWSAAARNNAARGASAVVCLAMSENQVFNSGRIVCAVLTNDEEVTRMIAQLRAVQAVLSVLLSKILTFFVEFFYWPSDDSII